MQKLLVVEDDQAVRTTMVTCLELEGYDVDAVSSTREAIARLSERSYPIVISDSRGTLPAARLSHGDRVGRSVRSARTMPRLHASINPMA